MIPESYSVHMDNVKKVKVLDIVTLFNSHRIHKTDYVVLKLDIEGMEFRFCFQ